MAYASITDVQNILTNKVVIGDRNIGTPVPGRPTQTDTITPDLVRQFIEYASEYVDARLKHMYVTPLRRIKTFETNILNDVTAGANKQVNVHDTVEFDQGDIVRIKDITGQTEDVVIGSISDTTTMVLVSVVGNYTVGNETTICILKVAEPIRLMTARYATAFIFDKLFSSEQDPNNSQFGKSQRNMAVASLEQILTGQIKLQGQEATGRRFVRYGLFDAYKSAAEVQSGQEKE